MNGGEQENPEIPTPSSYGTPPPPVEPPARIQWGVFFRLASPLAIVAGVVSSLFSPLISLLVVPLFLKRIISRYRPFHSGTLSAGQGRALGVFMALLSFAAFLVFALPAVLVQRPALMDKFRQIAAQNSDPQSQQFGQWITTNEGFVVIMTASLVFVLALFLITGAVSGAMITRTKNPPLAP